jgi:hypothetical protein
MKKLFAPFALFTVAVLLLSSCSNLTKISLTKRHYRSGYFVDFGGKKTAPAIAKLPARTKHQNLSSVIAKSEGSLAINTPTVNSEKPVISQNKIQENPPVNLTRYSTKQLLTEPFTIAENPSVQNKQTFSEENFSGGGPIASDGLSLLWIVIVILLILWLVGLLAGGWGLGGLINILLIIALVLLILWLLHIV